MSCPPSMRSHGRDGSNGDYVLDIVTGPEAHGLKVELSVIYYEAKGRDHGRRKFTESAASC